MCRGGWGRDELHVTRSRNEENMACSRHHQALAEMPVARDKGDTLTEVCFLQAVGEQLKVIEHEGDMLIFVLWRGHTARARETVPAPDHTATKGGSWGWNSGLCEPQSVSSSSTKLLFPFLGSIPGLGLAQCLWGICQPRPRPSSH